VARRIWIGVGLNGYPTDMASPGTEKVEITEARREIAGGDALAVDVRSDAEWGKGHVPGAIHLPDGEIGNPDALEDGARLMVIGTDGQAAEQVASRLRDQGYDAVAVEGDMEEWISEDFKIQPTADPDEDTELGLD
jgi:rhodanese-related sulfurtransferase